MSQNVTNFGVFFCQRPGQERLRRLARQMLMVIYWNKQVWHRLEPYLTKLNICDMKIHSDVFSPNWDVTVVFSIVPSPCDCHFPSLHKFGGFSGKKFWISEDEPPVLAEWSYLERDFTPFGFCRKKQESFNNKAPSNPVKREIPMSSSWGRFPTSIGMLRRVM